MKKMSNLLALLLVPALLALGVGCQTMQEHKIATGAVIGTAAGAAAGAAIGGKDNRTEGALIGAAAGAAIGTGIGYYLDRQAKKYDRIEGLEVEKVEQTTKTPADEVGKLPATTPPHINLRISSEFLFEKDSSALKAEGVTKLAEIATVLKEDADSRVIIKGYTSSEGSDAHNTELSERRANAVKNQLIGAGVEASRLTAVGLGESSPIGDNATEAGRARNRRVEIEVIPSEKSASSGQ